MSAWLTRAVLVQRAVVLGGASSNAAVAVARQHRSLTAAPCCQRRGGRRRADPGMAQLKAMLANHETQLNTGDAVGATANGGNPLQNAPLPSMEKLQALESSLNRGGEFGAAGTRAATEEVGGTAEGGTAANPDLQPRRQRGVRASRRRRVRDGTAEEIEMREMQEFLEQNKHLLQDNGMPPHARTHTCHVRTGPPFIRSFFARMSHNINPPFPQCRTTKTKTHLKTHTAASSSLCVFVLFCSLVLFWFGYHGYLCRGRRGRRSICKREWWQWKAFSTGKSEK